MRKIIYISGGITGVPDYREKFQTMEAKLKAKYPDAIILNPCRHPEGLTWEQYMTFAKRDVWFSDIIVMLQVWIDSRGARYEHQWASEQNKQIIHESEV